MCTLAEFRLFPQCSLYTKDTVCRGKLLPSTDWSSPTAISGMTLF